MRRRKLNKKRVALALLIPIFAIFLILGCNNNENKENKKNTVDKNLIINLSGMTIEEAETYCDENNLDLEIEEEYNSLKKGTVISQSINENTEIKSGDKITLKVSLGLDYNNLKVDELGEIPIMMYHGIEDVTDNIYTGGNIDKDGYRRTVNAFKEDLEFYYQSGYRMIRLNDYVNGIIDVEAGYSPLVLTFDDGRVNNIKVLGIDDNGEIIIDPNSAVGILEQFKKKYPDFNVTATFFVNAGLFSQPQYNEKILNWLIDNGYDIGNHSYSHADFTEISYEKAVQEIGSLYNILDKYIPSKYVKIVAMPFGSPYKKEHENFKAILKGKYNDKYYETISALRVAWIADSSPFDKSFDSTFLKRIRAYDNNGKDFDIEMNFKLLEKSRYISDGDKSTIVIPKSKEDKINNIYNLEVITY